MYDFSGTNFRENQKNKLEKFLPKKYTKSFFLQLACQSTNKDWFVQIIAISTTTTATTTTAAVTTTIKAATTTKQEQ